MAALRHSRPRCIRAALSSGFQKRQRNAFRRFKVKGPKWFCAQFLDPYDGDSDDPPRHPASGFSDCPRGAVSRPGSPRALRSGGPGGTSSEEPPASKPPGRPSRGPAPLEADDVDMQPAEAGSPQARGRAARRSGSPDEDCGMWEDRWPRAHAQGRGRAARPPPRLGSEKDKGPKLTLSKRKLELLLAEPEKTKRKRQYVAQSEVSRGSRRGAHAPGSPRPGVRGLRFS
uniref:Uncharacterized protein n=1 Tax=Canis lupus dingo TaxID=286419 RepID=A0A8C0KA43_CANLU